MMKQSILVVGILFLLACQGEQDAPETLPVPTQQTQTEKVDKTVVSPENKAETILAIDGMVCPSCQHTIQEEVLKMPGVVACEVSLENKDAKVVFDKTLVSPEKIITQIQTIEDGVYKAKLKEENKETETSESPSGETTSKSNNADDGVSVLSQLTHFEIPNLFTYFIEFIK